MTHFPVNKSFPEHRWKLMENRIGKSQRSWIHEWFRDGYNLLYGGPAMMSPHGHQQNHLMGFVQSTYFMKDTLPNQGPYPNRTSRDFRLKEGLLLQIRIRW
jgi:hypothetical protein